jgi:hypothetical protein
VRCESQETFGFSGSYDRGRFPHWWTFPPGERGVSPRARLHANFVSARRPTYRLTLAASHLDFIKPLSSRSVYFSPLADIIDSLARAEREVRLRERIRYLCRASLLIIDEIGYLSIGAGAGVSGTRAYPALVSFPNRRHTYGSPFGHGGQSSLRIDKKRHSIWFCRGFPLTEACRAGATGCISVVALRRKTLCSR